MKKMLRFEESGLDFGFNGFSNGRGIFFQVEEANKNRNSLGKNLTTKYPGAQAFLLEDGNIIVEPSEEEQTKVLKSIIEQNYSDVKGVLYLKFIFMILAIISAVIAIILLTKQNFRYCGFSYGWMCIFFSANRLSKYILLFGKRLLREKSTLQLCRFHSAEHAAVNAYYDLKRVPTIEEIKEYSWFSYTCSIASDFYTNWLLLGVGICGLFYGLYFFIAILIFWLFNCWAYKKNLYFTEIVLLAKPTDIEYKTAIEAMKAAIQEKENIDKRHEEGINLAKEYFSNSETHKALVEYIDIHPSNMH